MNDTPTGDIPPLPTSTPTVTSASPSLVERVKGILLRPTPEWQKIDVEPSTISGITTGYVLILAAIPAVAGFIGQSLIGISVLGITTKVSVVSGLIYAAVIYALSVASVYIAGFIIDALAPSFDGQKNNVQAFKVAAYSATASWVAGIFAAIPMLGVLGLLGIYGLYLLYTGLPILMRTPKAKSLGYTAVVVVIAIVIQIIIGAITAPILLMGTLAGGGLHTTGNVSINTPDGTVNVEGNSLETAAKRMESAAKAMQDGTAKPALDPALLDGLLPGSVAGAAKADGGTSAGGAGNYSTSEAHASYAVGTGRINLKITDIGALGAMTALGSAMKVQSSSQNGTSYEKVSTEGGKLVSERYDSAARSGSYTIVVGERIAIEAEGSDIDIATLKAAVASVDQNRAMALLK
ncbi:Yip1 family protein [Asticcacaulis sp. BYS171W]|uniref:Yip1 family protein n=1 Tax=Asticcacaulis aquaticus TaxID=2984212 RepID=A0ABT5HRL2_9CAUL|nr:Yip1 family protein [Asticcacaulis aquaticus]MDC7682711.1 Yip1 family protein [Asticcacaulis aquaticus]